MIFLKLKETIFNSFDYLMNSKYFVIGFLILSFIINVYLFYVRPFLN